MCLAIPMKVTKLGADRGEVESSGVTREVSFALLPDVKVGDYVLIHAGFAIERMDEEEAQKTFDLLARLVEAGEEKTKERP
jgi:hydrogenase expression/formation protein HypC